MTRNKSYYFKLGTEGYKAGKACTYKDGWQRVAWLDGFETAKRNSVTETRKEKANREVKETKARMAASHPDHGGTCEAFQQAHKDWKNAQARAAAM